MIETNETTVCLRCRERGRATELVSVESVLPGGGANRYVKKWLCPVCETRNGQEEPALLFPPHLDEGAIRLRAIRLGLVEHYDESVPLHFGEEEDEPLEWGRAPWWAWLLLTLALLAGLWGVYGVGAVVWRWLRALFGGG